MTNPPHATVAARHSAPLTERRYVVPLVLITTLFFLWALGVNLNDILIPHLKAAFGLTDFQSSFIQIAFFGGYFLAAFPAGWLMERIGYKKGILTGLLLCATGALLFLPAASSRAYGFFLFSLFVMASGQSFLEVAANPYVTTLGPPESAERRLNLTQSFNAVGAVLTPIIGAAFILTATEYTAAQLAQLTPTQVESYRAAQVSTVRGPYLAIAGIFLIVAVLIYFTHLPDVHEQADPREGGEIHLAWSKVLAHRHLVRGVLAQFLYVGAQVGVASFVIRFAQHVEPGISAKDAANYLKLHIFGFMLGRFIGSGIMKRISPPHLLALFAGGSFVCAVVAVASSGFPAVFAIVLIGFFHSIMFPTIFALSIKNLGRYTKRGSSLLVMSIIGGAICPGIMGRISDLSNIQHAFFVPLLCYAYVLYFGLTGYKPTAASRGQPAIEVASK
jgi:FHS family L-fucose permease-like MFS transporter